MDNDSQTAMDVIATPEYHQGNQQERLYDKVIEFRDKELSIPPFQREFVWRDTQVKSWTDSVMRQTAIGVIVTYQIKGGGRKYLADGMQRLTATSRFIDNPRYYGYEFNSEQAVRYCKAYSITVQHRIYKDHREAMESFQKLNSGTSLTRKEFYFGDLALTETGEMISCRVPAIVEKYESPLITKRKKGSNRNKSHAMARDTFALFYQYATESEMRSFWDVGQASPITFDTTRNLIIEKLVSEWASGKTPQDVETMLDKFDSFIASQTVLLREILNHAGYTGVAFTPAFFRWMLHLSIYRKNIGWSVNNYRMLIDRLLTYLMGRYSGFSTRFEVPNSNPIKLTLISMTNISNLDLICGAFDITKPSDGRIKKLKAAPGYNESHVMPFSIYGNGPTTIEPASINIARGANQQ